MTMEILTKADLLEFKTELLADIRNALKFSESNTTKKWLKSKEVRALLNISPGTLQTLRINGTLTYTKIGGIMYYDQLDIDKLLTKNKVQAIPTLFK